MSDQQQRLSSSGSHQVSSQPSSTRRTGKGKRTGSVQSSATTSNSLSQGGGVKSESTAEYSVYSLYTLYTADSSSEPPMSTERSSRSRQCDAHHGTLPPRSGAKGKGTTKTSKGHHSGRGNVDEQVNTGRDEEDYGALYPNEEYNESEGDPEFERVERQARVALETIAVKDEDVMVRLPEYLDTLRQYRRECSRRSMYKEAHLVQQVLRNLRLEEEARHIRGLTDHQMTERMRMEEVHRQEFRAFHTKWNERIDHFEEAQLEEEIAMLERQNDELLAFHEEMREYNPRVLRFSKALVHSRLKQHTLARQRNYARALVVKDEADDIEDSDIERFEKNKGTLYGRREQGLRRRHHQELMALKNKVQSRRNFLERSRKKELDEMLQRYINARRELETHQNIIRSKTGTILLKHACNTKTDTSGSQAIIMSAESGAFGPTIQHQTHSGRERQEAIEDHRSVEEEAIYYRTPGEGEDEEAPGGETPSCAADEEEDGSEGPTASPDEKEEPRAEDESPHAYEADSSAAATAGERRRRPVPQPQRYDDTGADTSYDEEH